MGVWLNLLAVIFAKLFLFSWPLFPLKSWGKFLGSVLFLSQKVLLQACSFWLKPNQLWVDIFHRIRAIPRTDTGLCCWCLHISQAEQLKRLALLFSVLSQQIYRTIASPLYSVRFQFYIHRAGLQTSPAFTSFWKRITRHRASKQALKSPLPINHVQYHKARNISLLFYSVPFYKSLCLH